MDEGVEKESVEKITNFEFLLDEFEESELSTLGVIVPNIQSILMCLVIKNGLGKKAIIEIVRNLLKEKKVM